MDDPNEPAKFTDPATCFKEELDMVDQMVVLLPQQIARVHHLKQDFN